MYFKKHPILLILSLLCLNTIFAQNRREFKVDFRVGESSIEPEFSNNAEHLSGIISFLQQIEKDNTIELISISLNGASSPEGSFELNSKLANDRLTSLENYVNENIEIPNTITITRDHQYIQWDYLASLIENSNLTYKDEVLSILNEQLKLTNYHDGGLVDSRIVKLKALHNGLVWKTIDEQFFKYMRNASAIFVTLKRELPLIQEVEKPVPNTSIIELPSVVEENEKRTALFVDTVPKTTVPEVKEWTRQLYLKTNAVGLGLLIANAAIELDLSPHWSFTLPVYYSAWNYFTHTVKFRTFCVQPEIRYWFSENDGWFVGAHFGMAYYNFALNGDYRIQDFNKSTPALGGGLGIGYRMPISKSKRLKMEFLLGGGVYDLQYDKFHNQHNGFLVESIKDTYFGIDQVAVSFSYMFDLKRRRR